MAIRKLRTDIDRAQRYACLTTDTFPTPSTETELDVGAVLYVLNEATEEHDKYEWTGLKWLKTHYRGTLNTHDADVHNVPVNEYFHQHTGVISTLSVASSGEDYQVTVANGTVFANEDLVKIGNGVRELTYPTIKSVVGNVLTLDRFLDFDHAVGTTVEKINTNMAVDGTLAAPQKFIIQPEPEPGDVWHITRLLLTLTHGTAGDLGLFGNLVALANGLQIRANVGGQYYTFTNWKTSAAIKDDMYDVEFDARSSGGGTYGTSGRGSFHKIGVAVRLDGTVGDFMEVSVVDALAALITLNIKGQGHFE